MKKIQINNLSPAQFASFTITQLNYFTPAQFAVLTQEQINTLNADKLICVDISKSCLNGELTTSNPLLKKRYNGINFIQKLINNPDYLKLVKSLLQKSVGFNIDTDFQSIQQLLQELQPVQPVQPVQTGQPVQSVIPSITIDELISDLMNIFPEKLKALKVLKILVQLQLVMMTFINGFIVYLQKIHQNL